MTEYDSFQNAVSELTIEANHTEHYLEPSDDTTPRAGLDVTRGVFITSRGDEIELSGKPINKLMLERLVNEGKPKIPMIEVTLLGKHKQMQANANDPSYLALMDEWTNDLKIKTMRYLFTVGVKGKPPQTFVEEQRQITPEANDADMKYFWLGSLLSDDEIVALQEVIVGQNFTTAKGLEEAADSFRS